MSNWATAYANRGKGGVSDSKAVEGLSEDYPELAKLLCGIPGKASGTFEVPRATLMFFVEGSRLKFCINIQDGDECAFGCCDDPSKPWHSVNRALADGDFEWKSKKGKSRS